MLRVLIDVLETFLSKYLIKVTLRITGLLIIRVLIYLEVWHLDVGSNSSWYVHVPIYGELILYRIT